MAGPVDMHSARTYALPLESAFDQLLPMPLPTLFDRRYAVIPGIRATTGDDGGWGTAGQTRTVRLRDGGSMREELTAVDRPHRFGYTLTGFVGPFRLLTNRVDGSWSFVTDGAGTRITWAWRVHPAGPWARPLLPAFRRMWTGYAARSLARLNDLFD